MKKIVASVGLVALGASALQTASAQGLAGPDASKPWSVSATLRGFYDDNVRGISDDIPLPDGQKRDSLGFEISPSARFVWAQNQTAVSLGYLYSFKYYENEPPFSEGHDDQTHTFNLALNHAFTERYRVQLEDSFVIGQEPDLLRAGSTFTTFQSVPGDNIRNYGGITFSADLTPVIGAEIGYDNAFFDYDDDGPGSRSALLDRMEHLVHLDGKYKVGSQTTAILGYAYGQTDYLADELIGFLADGTPVLSEVRNSRSHYGYAGVEHNFTPELSASLRVGARYIDFYNDPFSENDVSPFLRGSVRYFYGPENYVDGGFGYDRTSTDLFNISGDSLTTDADTATVFGSVHHRLLTRLYGNLVAQYQHSEYNGGGLESIADDFFLVGLQLEYRITQNFAAEAGYNFDLLESDIDFRGFDRNRVYIGVTASY